MDIPIQAQPPQYQPAQYSPYEQMSQNGAVYVPPDSMHPVPTYIPPLPGIIQTPPRTVSRPPPPAKIHVKVPRLEKLKKRKPYTGLGARGKTKTELHRYFSTYPANVGDKVIVIRGESRMINGQVKQSMKFLAGRHVFYQIGPKKNGKIRRFKELADR
eukprot:UN31706